MPGNAVPVVLSKIEKSNFALRNKGGAPGHPVSGQSVSSTAQSGVDLTNAEPVQLQVRVIALENLVTALLAGASENTTHIAQALAADISPRDGHTPHLLTIHAAELMVHLVERSARIPDRLKTK